MGDPTGGGAVSPGASQTVARSLVMREVEAVVSALGSKSEIDRGLLEYLAAHVMRYIVTLKVQGRRKDEDPEIVKARRNLEAIGGLWESKGGDVPPFEDESSVLKRFLEAEDIELMGMQFESLAAELDSTRKELDVVRAQLETAEGKRPGFGEAIELQQELESREQEVLALRERLKLLEERGLPAGGAGGSEELDRTRATLEKWKVQMKDIAARFRSLETQHKAAEEDRKRLVDEIAEWRRRFTEFQATMDQRIRERAQELFRAEISKEMQRIGALKARDAFLKTIEDSHSLIKMGDGFIVVPKTVLRTMDVGPGETVQYVFDGKGARLVKTRT